MVTRERVVPRVGRKDGGGIDKKRFGTERIARGKVSLPESWVKEWREGERAFRSLQIATTTSEGSVP